MSKTSYKHLNIFRLFFPDIITEIKGEILVIDSEYTSNIFSVTVQLQLTSLLVRVGNMSPC